MVINIHGGINMKSDNSTCDGIFILFLIVILIVLLILYYYCQNYWN